METIKNNKTLEQFKCPNCSGDVTFNSSMQKMACPFCDCEFDIGVVKELSQIEDLKDFEFEEYTISSGSGDWKEEEKSKIKAYTCNSCGGEVVTEDVTVASKCPYCDSPIVVSSDLQGVLRPDIVIPFKLEKLEAVERLKNFCNGKKLLPNFFLDENRIEEIQGVYVPFWVFSLDVNSQSTFNANKVHTWMDSNYTYTQTKTYLAYRDGTAIFGKIPADASMKMDDAMMDSIEPFNYQDAVDFNSGYLSGYVAQKYDVPSKDVESRIRHRITNTMQNLFRNSIHGYSSVSNKTIHFDASNIKIEYALLPVWILNTKYKEKVYTFAMNGQTGKFVGKLPIDDSKVTKYFLVSFITAFVFLMIFCVIGGML